MANVKGEKIATNLLGRVVTSGDGNDPNAKHPGWPAYWTKPPAQRAEEVHEPWRIEGRAEVVAVFLRDGEVRLLLNNPFGKHELIDVPAKDWRVTT